MIEYKIIKIKENEEIIKIASKWFNEKWEIPEEAYIESMKDDDFMSQWYVAMHDNKIIAGVGVIENDFHNRKDLSPNICALYVEEEYRNQGIAKNMLNFVCDDFVRIGVKNLYLVTDHTSFYEKYNWKFLCMVECEGEDSMLRMYIKDL
ncbi:GNAT family N-acetyltransferase [Arcobacter sp. CECT 9188]|uniref:GNAT family N-acetyltransferase n=1 Tax=Arcobacter sp. CECT 9188 TaxID=2044505 RepID=UPI000DEA0A50|nr:GNAT family N-acetyltransferase [Arcobacter sp. CECT 9188]RBQ26444.1 GNAT family N-acetyltransferase [Arcobacter sp. CECT 9188]